MSLEFGDDRLGGPAKVAIGVATVLLFKALPSELAPAEDRGTFQVMAEGPEGASFDYTVAQMKKVEQVLLDETGPGKPLQRANPRCPDRFRTGSRPSVDASVHGEIG